MSQFLSNAACPKQLIIFSLSKPYSFILIYSTKNYWASGLTVTHWEENYEKQHLQQNPYPCFSKVFWGGDGVGVISSSTWCMLQKKEKEPSGTLVPGVGLKWRADQRRYRVYRTENGITLCCKAWDTSLHFQDGLLMGRVCGSKIYWILCLESLGIHQKASIIDPLFLVENQVYEFK